jgi:tRNA1Val (adenine37-N6)-methyltransferase
MSAFQFKRFRIEHDKSTFKVGTDAVLLGAWVLVPSLCKHILDIGSGCGVVSLMLAQRSDARIIGIDIDRHSVEEATENANNSPWRDRIKFINTSIQNFYTIEHKNKFDLIVSNPPFFVNSLKSPMYKRNISRHTDRLPFNELILSIDYCLSPSGLFAIIIPTTEKDTIQMLCENQGLFCTNVLQIKPIENKEVNRIILLFSRNKEFLHIENISIRNTNKEYTQSYQLLTKDFYLNF